MKHIKNNSLIIILLIIVNTVFAQQDPTYTLYQYNMNVINPAYAGVDDNATLNMNFRSQWVNLNGGPETQSVFFATPINNKIGAGLSIVHDKVFVLNTTDVYADFSYKLKVSENSNLYFGLKAGGSFINVDLNSLGIQNDPVFTENVSQFNPNFGVGFYLKGSKYYVNLSAPSILKSKRYEKNGILVSNATDELHIYAGAGYTFNLNDNIDLIPSLMSRIVAGSPISLDITATANFYKTLELGMSYRLDESVSALGLFKLADWFHFGYAYEITTTEVADYSDGTHEIFLQFRF